MKSLEFHEKMSSPTCLKLAYIPKSDNSPKPSQTLARAGGHFDKLEKYSVLVLS